MWFDYHRKGGDDDGAEHAGADSHEDDRKPSDQLGLPPSKRSLGVHHGHIGQKEEEHGDDDEKRTLC